MNTPNLLANLSDCVVGETPWLKITKKDKKFEQKNTKINENTFP